MLTQTARLRHKSKYVHIEFDIIQAYIFIPVSPQMLTQTARSSMELAKNRNFLKGGLPSFTFFS